MFGGAAEQQTTNGSDDQQLAERRRQVAWQLANGQLENEVVTVEIEEQQPMMFDLFQGAGLEQMGVNMQDMLSSFMPKSGKTKIKSKRSAPRPCQRRSAKVDRYGRSHARSDSTRRAIGHYFY